MKLGLMEEVDRHRSRRDGPFAIATPPSDDEPSALSAEPFAPPDAEEDRPPSCPVCQKRLVILSTRILRDAIGNRLRRQLWGCPRGHATATRAGNAFGPIEILPDLG